ncbi:hypothetical protein BGZ63DRAFT_409971 [Mariannaea sp. PMI_226]|nr:hypothetical protein BGZ63DRAFT_409971 [Mariannaea sp. PMI_226]
MSGESLTSFTIEAWTYLGISLVVIAIRFGARWRWLGFSGLAPDDFLMLLAGLAFAGETAAAHYVGAYWHGLSNNGLTDEQRQALDPNSTEYHRRVHSSKTAVFGWQIYTILLWTLKLCWLFLFKRLGEGVHHMSLKINIGFALVGVTFFATSFTILFACWPLHKKWQINPDPGNKCYPAVSHVQAWTIIWTNLITDLYIMSIPLPMIFNSRVSKTKKFGLAIMFCGGLATAVFGGLRCGYILHGGPEGTQLAGEWSCRESFVAVIVTNIPVLMPFIIRLLHKARAQYLGCIGSASDGTPNAVKTHNAVTLNTIGGGGRKRDTFRHPLSIPDDTLFERFGSDEEVGGGSRRETTVTSSTSKSYELKPSSQHHP